LLSLVYKADRQRPSVQESVGTQYQIGVNTFYLPLVARLAASMPTFNEFEGTAKFCESPCGVHRPTLPTRVHQPVD